MRILLAPVFNYPRNLQADSIYTITADWSRRMCEAAPDIAIYRLLPNANAGDWRRKHEDVNKKVHPRVHDLYVDMMCGYDLEEAHADYRVLDRFHPISGSIAIDGVVSTSAVKSLVLKRLFGGNGGKSQLPQMFSFDLLMRGGNSTNEVSTVTPDDCIAQAAGHALSCVMYESPMCKRIALENARNYLSPALVDQIEQKGFLAYTGFEDSETVPLSLDKREKDFTVVVRGRMTGSKRVEDILDVYNHHHSMGMDIKVLLTTGDLRVPEPLKQKMLENSNIKLLKLGTKAEANQVMRKAHAFILYSTHELFCVSLWEMLAAGLIGLIYEAPWHHGMLPPKYPFVFKNKMEAHAMMVELHKNYNYWAKELAWVSDWVRDKYAYRNTVPRTMEWMRGKMEECASPTQDWATEILQKHGKDSLTMEEAFGVIGDHANFGVGATRGKSGGAIYKTVGPRNLANALIAAGYKDVLEMSDPLFIRQK